MRIVFFTGAGISQESGLRTFRDAGGLWEGQPVAAVCSTEAWSQNPAKVLDFYNQRRKGVREAEPNAAHRAIAGLEDSGHTVAVVTQNIDDLHERAGSRNVLHLHGEIVYARSERNDGVLYPCPGDIAIGDTAPDGGQLRPHVVFFGETIYGYEDARSVCKRADALVVVGTSLAVYPAAYLAKESNARTIYVVDPGLATASLATWEGRKIVHFAHPATVGVPGAIRRILELPGGKATKKENATEAT